MSTNKKLILKPLCKRQEGFPKNLEEMNQYQNLLNGYLSKFLPYGTTLPIECDLFCSLMERIKCAAENLHEYFRHNSFITNYLDINEYLYISDLYNIENYTCELSLLSSEFRLVCLDQTKESRRISEKIRCELSDLHEAVNIFLNRTKPIESYLFEQKNTIFN